MSTAVNPIPAEPSAESRRLLKRGAANRRFMERNKAHGVSLHLLRLIMNTAARLGRMPVGASARERQYGEGVSGLEVTTPETDPGAGVLLWVHGGGFVSGSPRLERTLAAQYCARAGIPAFLPRYRLAPEHPFPAAADDVLDAYLALLRTGFAAERIRLVGLSSGGALVAGLLGDLVRGGLPMPAGVLLMSPLLDLSCATLRRRDAEHPDPFSGPGGVERTTAAYVAGTPLTDPRLDLLGADLSGWPPVLVQTGGEEFLTAEAEQFGAAMRAAGAECEVQIWPGQVHGFQALGFKKIPEARAAVEYGARFLAGGGLGAS